MKIDRIQNLTEGIYEVFNRLAKCFFFRLGRKPQQMVMYSSTISFIVSLSSTIKSLFHILRKNNELFEFIKYHIEIFLTKFSKVNFKWFYFKVYYLL